MPYRDRRRKRALDTDGGDAERTKTLRSLFASKRMSVAALEDVVQMLERDPDLLSAGTNELRAANAGYFESVRRTQMGTLEGWHVLRLGHVRPKPSLAARAAIRQKTLNRIFS